MAFGMSNLPESSGRTIGSALDAARRRRFLPHGFHAFSPSPEASGKGIGLRVDVFGGFAEVLEERRTEPTAPSGRGIDVVVAAVLRLAAVDHQLVPGEGLV